MINVNENSKYVMSILNYDEGINLFLVNHTQIDF